MRLLSLLGLFIFVSSDARGAASISISPASQSVGTSCAASVSASGLVGAKGLDLRIRFDANVLACSSAAINEGALPGFTEFHRSIDNDAGCIEIVLLKQSPGGFSGDAQSVLTVRFDPVSSGSSLLYVEDTGASGDPLLIDAANARIEAAVDTATIIVDNEPTPSVTAVRLRQNYPNPFNPGTTIMFEIPSRSSVSLEIYGADGRLVRRLLDGDVFDIGVWSTPWNGKTDAGLTASSGVYFCVLRAAGKTASRKLVLLR